MSCNGIFKDVSTSGNFLLSAHSHQQDDPVMKSLWHSHLCNFSLFLFLKKHFFFHLWDQNILANNVFLKKCKQTHTHAILQRMVQSFISRFVSPAWSHIKFSATYTMMKSGHAKTKHCNSQSYLSGKWVFRRSITFFKFPEKLHKS